MHRPILHSTADFPSLVERLQKEKVQEESPTKEMFLVVVVFFFFLMKAGHAPRKKNLKK